MGVASAAHTVPFSSAEFTAGDCARRCGHAVSAVLFSLFALQIASCAQAGPRADENAGEVYLTFDDGPIDITLAILDVLKRGDVKATFFINAIHLDGTGGERETRAREALRRIVAEGHALGNHSYDHMAHNRPPGVYAMGAAQAYLDLETDLSYFLAMNVAPINAALGELVTQSNNRITQLTRLPFANAWSFPELDLLCNWCKAAGHAFWHPDARARANIEVSEIGGELAEALQRRYRMHVFGWDVQWMPADWSSPVSNETLPSEAVIVAQIAALLDRNRYCTRVSEGDRCKSPVRPHRVVVLMHDFLFENGPRGRGEAINLPRLIKLIHALKGRGYRFETLDHYLD